MMPTNLERDHLQRFTKLKDGEIISSAPLKYLKLSLVK
jgi:hypothetical protein